MIEFNCDACGKTCKVTPDFLHKLIDFTKSEKDQLSSSLRTLFTRNPGSELFVLGSGRDVMEANWLARVRPERRGH